MPARAVVLAVVRRAVSDPWTYVRQYNALSMDEAGTTWAVFPACGLATVWLPCAGSDKRRPRHLPACRRSRGEVAKAGDRRFRKDVVEE